MLRNPQAEVAERYQLVRSTTARKETMKTHLLLTSLIVTSTLVLGTQITGCAPAEHVDRVSWNRWIPQSGYSWIDPGNASHGVRWRAGLRNADIPHVVSDEREGFWRAEDGYEFPVPGQLSAPHWVAAKAHPTAPHVLSSQVEQQWVAEPGYAFMSQTPGDLRVAMLPPPSSPSHTAGGDSGERVALAVLKFAVAAMFSRDQDDDGVVMQQVVRPMARELRDQSLREGVAALTDR